MHPDTEAFISKHRGAEFPHSTELFELLAGGEAKLVYGPSLGDKPSLCRQEARIYRQRAWTMEQYQGEKDSQLQNEMVEIAAAMEATPDEHCKAWIFKSTDSVTYHILERVESSTIAFCFKRPGPAVKLKSP